MPLADDARVGGQLPADGAEPRGVGGTQRSQEGAELSEHLRFPDHGRVQAADRFEQERIGIGIGEDLLRRVAALADGLRLVQPGFVKDDLAETGAPGRLLESV